MSQERKMEVKSSNIHVMTVDKDLARGKNFAKSTKEEKPYKDICPPPFHWCLNVNVINIFPSYFVISSTAYVFLE